MSFYMVFTNALICEWPNSYALNLNKENSFL